MPSVFICLESGQFTQYRGPAPRAVGDKKTAVELRALIPKASGPAQSSFCKCSGGKWEMTRCPK